MKNACQRRSKNYSIYITAQEISWAEICQDVKSSSLEGAIPRICNLVGPQDFSIATIKSTLMRSNKAKSQISIQDSTVITNHVEVG